MTTPEDKEGLAWDAPGMEAPRGLNPVTETGTALIRPLFDRVVVQRIEAKKTQGTLHLPESAIAKAPAGTVIAMGIGRIGSRGEIIPLQVKIGEVVSFDHRAGTEVIVAGETCLLLKETDIYGVQD